MAVNAGPLVSWGLYKANNLPLAFVRWWIDGPESEAPVTGGGFTIVALKRLTRAKSYVITKGVATGRVTGVRVNRVMKIAWTGLSYKLGSRR